MGLLIKKWLVLSIRRRFVTSLKSSENLFEINEIPGPKPSLPIIGTSWIYYPMGRYQKDKMHHSYEDKYHRYGSVVREDFQFGNPLILVFESEDIEKVMRNQGRYPERPINEAVKHFRKSHPDRYCNVGLVNSQQEEWYELRKKLTPILMKPSTVIQYLTEQNAISDDLVKLMRLKLTRDNRIDDFHDLLFLHAMESVCLFCLDQRLGTLNSVTPVSATNLITAVHMMWKYYQELYFSPPVWKYFATTAYRKFAENETYIYDQCSNYIGEAIKAKKCSQNLGYGRTISILQMMLNTSDIDRRDIQMTMVDFMAAGIDNTANSIIFNLYQLATNPECQQKAYEEIRNLIDPESLITSRILNSISYLKLCIKETFRLMPTIPNLVRMLPEDIAIKNYLIPSKVPISCNTYVACRSEHNFPQPLKFSPERWIKDSINPFLVLPFGWGPRMCVGRRFAEQEILVTLVKAHTITNTLSANLIRSRILI